MASQAGEEEVVALVKRLASEGKPFTIALEAPNSLLVDSINRGLQDSVDLAGGDCLEWVYVPGKGLVCVRRG